MRNVVAMSGRLVSSHPVTEGKKTEKSMAVGRTLAARAKDAGITRVVFDRAGYKYHGRVKAVAEGAREGGLDFYFYFSF